MEKKYFTKDIRQIETLKKYKDRIESFIIPPPVNYMINIINYCNLSCPYCYYKPHMMNHVTIDDKLFYSMEYEISLADSISFTSIGEAMLNKKLYEYINFIRSINKNVILSLVTNGMVPIKDEEIDIFHKNGLYLAISLDSLRPEVLKKLRPQADIDTIISFFKRFVERKKLFPNTTSQIGFNAVVTKHNIDYLYELMDFVKDYGGKSLFFINLAPSHKNIDKIHEYQISKDDIIRNQQNFDYMLNIAQMNDIIFSGTFVKKYISHSEILDICDNKLLNKCLDPWFFCLIHTLGFVRVCAGQDIPYEGERSLPFFGKINDYEKTNLYEYVDKIIEERNIQINDKNLKEIYNWIDNTNCPGLFRIWNSPQAITLRKQLLNDVSCGLCDACIRRDYHNMWTNCA